MAVVMPVSMAQNPYEMRFTVLNWKMKSGKRTHMVTVTICDLIPSNQLTNDWKKAKSTPGSGQGRSQDFSRGTHNFPNPPTPIQVLTFFYQP